MHISSVFSRILMRGRGFVFRILIHAYGGSCGKGLLVNGGGRFAHPFHAGINIGRDVLIGRNVCIEVRRGAQFILGDNVKLTRDIIISAVDKIEIDVDAIVAEYVSIRDHDHGTALGTPIRLQPVSSAPIHIGRDVWLARGVTILKGCTLGDGVIVGANAVVTKDLPTASICVGVPARVVRYRQSQ
jgi:acetyltransferase-like isoleucine patch superfamily enzyme